MIEAVAEIFTSMKLIIISLLSVGRNKFFEIFYSFIDILMSRFRNLFTWTLASYIILKQSIKLQQGWTIYQLELHCQTVKMRGLYPRNTYDLSLKVTIQFKNL